MVLLFCWVGMVGIKSGNACGKDKDENAVVLPVYERNGRMYVEIEQTYLGREWMVLAQTEDWEFGGSYWRVKEFLDWNKAGIL